MEKRVIDEIRRTQPLPHGVTDKSIVQAYEGSLYAAQLQLRFATHDLFAPFLEWVGSILERIARIRR